MFCNKKKKKKDIYLSLTTIEIHLDFWSAWGVSIAYIGVCMVINLLGIANLGRATFFFSLFTLVPFALFSILGLFSSQVNLRHSRSHSPPFP